MKNEALKTFKLKDGKILEIFADDTDGDTPRDWDNLGKMVCWHSRYRLGDKHNFADKEEFQEFWENEGKGGILIPIQMYEHSGITIYAGERQTDHWDTSAVGYIYATKELIIKEFGKCDTEDKEKVTKILLGEIDIYDQYIKGEVYRFVLSEVKTCSEKCEHTKEIDSCSGFYGAYFAEDEIFDHAEISKEDVLEEVEA